jgi:hypothetical protein
MVKEKRMRSVKGQQRVGKDAIFQGPCEPERIAAGEHNGGIGHFVPEVVDQCGQFGPYAMMDTRLEALLGIAAHQRGGGTGLHER